MRTTDWFRSRAEEPAPPSANQEKLCLAKRQGSMVHLTLSASRNNTVP
jgi:hypothetical protein